MLGPQRTLPIARLGYHYGLPFQLALALGVACFCQVWRMPGKGPGKKRCFGSKLCSFVKSALNLS